MSLRYEIAKLAGGLLGSGVGWQVGVAGLGRDGAVAAAVCGGRGKKEKMVSLKAPQKLSILCQPH